METKEFAVTIVVTERYVVHVEAEDWETAESMAQDIYNSQELDLVSYSETFEAEEV
jgi:hypothetical protein